MMKYRALGWIGGKSVYSNTGTGRWVNSLLPAERVKGGYVEPFAGMLGILLQRSPARREIVSDVDKNVINWWRVVRDQNAELVSLLDNTPTWSADLFSEAVENLHHSDPVRRAYYFTLCVSWVRGGMFHLINVRKSDSSLSRIGRTDAHRVRFPKSVNIVRLRDRMKDVELENRDARWMLEYYGDNPDILWYLDPPYQIEDKRALYTTDFRVDDILPLVAEVKGACAISGYGGEWDELDWHRSEYSTATYAFDVKHRKKVGKVEVLWTNYRPDRERLF